MRNAQDGVSLIQTAEGALNEVSSILQRMRELAVQAKNGTLSNEDADAVRLELVELEAEIDRIADTTEFNSKTLLTGSFLQASLSSNAAGLEIVSDTATQVLAGGVYRSISVTDPAISGNNYSVVDTAGSAVCMQGQITVAGQLVTLIQVITVTDTAATIGVGSSFAFNFSTFGISFSVENVSTQTLTGAQLSALIDTDTILVTSTAGASSNMVLQIGANPNQVATISLVDARSQSLGGSVSSYGNIEDLIAALASNNMTDLADEMISMVDLAILDVNQARSGLGANQNRLGFTVNNLTVSAENLAASESRIRDADIALETVAFVKAQILQQAGTAVLAQANQAPQTVLALLR